MVIKGVYDEASGTDRVNKGTKLKESLDAKIYLRAMVKLLGITAKDRWGLVSLSVGGELGGD